MRSTKGLAVSAVAATSQPLRLTLPLASQAVRDMLLMPEDFQSAYQGVLGAVKDGTVSEERIDESVRRILELKLEMEK